MRFVRPLARIRGRIAFWAALGAALLVSHDATFLVQVGPGEAVTRVLRTAGHDYWGAASLALAIIGVLALAGSLLRLRQLRRAARLVRAAPVQVRRPYAVRWLRMWARMSALVAIGFVIQENVEHIIGHGHAPGFGALIGPEYPLALPVIGLVTAVASLLAAWVGEAERALLEVIAGAIGRLGRPPRLLVRPPLRLLAALASPLALDAAGRAPPRRVASFT